MSIVQRAVAKLKGESEEFKVNADYSEQLIKVAPFTETQEVRFYELTKFTESSEFYANWNKYNRANRALEIGEKYKEWAKEVVQLLKEVSNVRHYAHAIELLCMLRIKRHDIYVKHDIATVKKHAAERAKADNAVKKKILLRERQEVLSEIERYEQEISAAQERLDAWKPLEFSFEPIILKGRAYQVTSFGADAQSEYTKIRTSSGSVTDQIEEFVKSIFTPAPRTKEDANHLFEYFEEANTHIFPNTVSNNKIHYGSQTAIFQNKSFIEKSQEHLKSINEQLERVAELEALQL